jgi:hypothetical protein
MCSWHNFKSTQHNTEVVHLQFVDNLVCLGMFSTINSPNYNNNLRHWFSIMAGWDWTIGKDMEVALVCSVNSTNMSEHVVVAVSVLNQSLVS